MNESLRNFSEKPIIDPATGEPVARENIERARTMLKDLPLAALLKMIADAASARLATQAEKEYLDFMVVLVNDEIARRERAS